VKASMSVPGESVTGEAEQPDPICENKFCREKVPARQGEVSISSTSF